MFPWMRILWQLSMPGILPLLALALKGGLALGSSLLGNKLGKVKPNPQEDQTLKLLQGSMQANQQTGQNLVHMGQQTIGQPLNYYQGILSGNRGDIQSALQPELNRVNEGFQNARQTSAELMPRGGARASQIGALPFQQQQAQSELMQGARPQAAGALGGLAGQLMQSGIGAISTASSQGRDILNQNQRMRELEAQRGQSIGSGLFDLVQKFGFPAIDQLMKPKGLSN